MNDLPQELSRLPFFGKIYSTSLIPESIERYTEAPEVHLTGLAGSFKGIFASMLFTKREKQFIYVAPDAYIAHQVWNDVSLVLGDDRVLLIGEPHKHKHAAKISAENLFAENADLLRSLLEEPIRFVVTDADSLLKAFPTQKHLRENSLQLARRSSMRQDDLVKRIAYGGFERKEFVLASGEYAVRGGIIDVFPIGFDNPIRLEFFGDEIDSIREFDALSQRSIKDIHSIGIVTSLFLDGSEYSDGTMFDYFQNDALLFIDEFSRIEQASESISTRQWEETQELMKAFPTIYHSVIGYRPAKEDPEAASAIVEEINCDLQPAFNSSIRLLKENLEELEEHHFAIFLIADSEKQAERLSALLNEAENGEDPLPDAPERKVFVAPFSQGFILPDIGLAVYTEHQIFNRREVQRRARKGFKGISLREMRQLHVGDYVVHVDKGIGKFAGFHTISVMGGKQETAKLLYADNDVLYVNLHYINRVQKFSSQEGHTPKLSKLGSGDWDRAKAKTKKRLKEIARDLIQLYARRKIAKGFAFSEDSHWQREMEASFLYEDTVDQARAAEDVKNDMIQAVPMDRLVCGDVGYGKTEVAVRAAFKAAVDGKQVAVLVPTTILAQQHYHTFLDRLHRYSVNVESLSRFKTKNEQKEIVRKIAMGEIDVIIGTHRLLSDDVVFKDLGLLIIDEEHRFGVNAKEKLRTLREHIDTLTLTATPIPRTLNFSLLGARDLSVIETPPRNRLPIITEIVHMTPEVIQEGLLRELERNGQAYFVHDRINDIELMAQKIRQIVPQVRLAIAHGQMHATDLERVMMRFMERKFDLLVCTKIIESGLDIPNANTIFINRADRFGLAELYQLRGRVGRSNIQAHAYILIPPESKMSHDALKRLQALEEFTELGTGFQLAMRDMEIRGAGNLLGAEQSGYIEEIGFDLYMKTLEEAVQELKEEEFADLFKDRTAKKKLLTDVVMELGIDAYLPQEYVKDATERFDYYKRLYNVETAAEINDIENELLDRFGLFPHEVNNILYVIALRLKASVLHFATVSWDQNDCTFLFPPEDDEEFYTQIFQPISEYVMKHSDIFQMHQYGKQLKLIKKNVEAIDEVEAALNVFIELVEKSKQKEPVPASV